MRSRRRFSTNGFSICDQRERESGPTGPRLSAATRASDSAAGKAPCAPSSSPTPGCLGLVHSLSLTPSFPVARPPLLPALCALPCLCSTSSSCLPSVTRLSSLYISVLCGLLLCDQ
uniref:Uncharacterized protein n=1 Tax=Cricetulus griseus TaxID=10029 RepID=A0A8C2LMT1_CRIGR